MNYVGDFVDDATVYIPFNTFDSNDPSASVTITNLASGDVEVWKNGVVQTTPGAGVTLTLNIGANNGSHLIAVDTSNTTDSGWFATGNDYQVRINGTTVDSATINAWVGSFSIQNRFMRGTDSANTTVPDAAGTAAVPGDQMNLVADAITSAKIADNAIAAEHLATDAITADALAADAITEIWAKAMTDLAQGAPSATASVLTAINYLYESWRNKTLTTATLITIFKDDGTTELVRSTISDDATTFTKGEIVTGV